MFEYAVTNGKGKLIGYGILDDGNTEFGWQHAIMQLVAQAHVGGGDVLLAKCDENCLTGK